MERKQLATRVAGALAEDIDMDHSYNVSYRVGILNHLLEHIYGQGHEMGITLDEIEKNGMSGYHGPYGGTVSINDLNYFHLTRYIFNNPNYVFL